MISLDYLTIIVAAIVNVILGFLWYSPYVFGRLWLQLIHRHEKEMKITFFSLLGGIIISLFLSFFLALVEAYMGVTSFWDGVVAGFIVWFGFVLPTQFSIVLWEKRPIKLFFIDNGIWLLGMLVMGGILAG
ncbi:MAG: DUF1761 domain-containing protein [Parachlamydiales bacterium]|nr:DUF1761 domain-containing protein [Parachlamydiales bacterium]